MTNFPLRLGGDFTADLYLLAAQVTEGMNVLTETRIEFACADREVDLEPLLGRPLQVILKVEHGGERVFPGICTSIEFVGAAYGVAHYSAELRPKLWFLGRRRECRVFQDLSVVDILKEVLGGYDLWGDVQNKLNDSYPVREYTIQYRETDLDFIRRLTEEEGIYFHTLIDGFDEKIVLADGTGSHQPIPLGMPVPFRPLDEASHRMGWHIYNWSSGLGLTSGKITLNDYNFETPGADLKSGSELPMGTHPDNDHEIYDYPGHFRKIGDGEHRAKVRMEAEAVRHKTAAGSGCFAGLAVGQTFSMIDHVRITENAEWLLTDAVHLMRQTSLVLGEINPAWLQEGAEPLTRLGADLGDDIYRVDFAVIPSDQQYRGPLITPWPEIAGVHTAVVTGPAGEEIYPDKYGRVKVRFHWDRLGAADEKSSCWIRCMMPWTGNRWGMIHIPRIGQEVVVDFEEGDPDRPLIVGMLYNADTMPPYELPANKTQSGVKTRSSKDSKGFNELMFEDKAGSELVRFQAERDYEQIVKNNATITVGETTKKDGDMHLTVHNHLKTDVKEGQYTLNVHKDDYAAWVAKDHWEIIDGNKDKTVKGEERNVITKDVTREIKQGNLKDTVKMGNVDYDVKMGNIATKLGLGNMSVKADLGKITMEAMQSIELKVGGSSVKIDMMGVTIKGPMIKVDGQMMTEVKGGIMTKVEGGAMLVLKGGITMIN